MITISEPARSRLQRTAAGNTAELATLRAAFNPSERGGWGVLFLPALGWVVVRGKQELVRAESAAQLAETLTLSESRSC